MQFAKVWNVNVKVNDLSSHDDIPGICVGKLSCTLQMHTEISHHQHTVCSLRWYGLLAVYAYFWHLYIFPL